MCTFQTKSLMFILKPQYSRVIARVHTYLFRYTLKRKVCCIFMFNAYKTERYAFIVLTSILTLNTINN